MIDRRREIFVKIDKINEIVDLLKVIKEKEEHLHSLFNQCDKLTEKENRTFDNWNSYLEDTLQKLDHVTL